MYTAKAKRTTYHKEEANFITEACFISYIFQNNLSIQVQLPLIKASQWKEIILAELHVRAWAEHHSLINLPIQENLVITWPYTDRPTARPSVRTTGKPMFTFTLSNYFGSPGGSWLHINVVINCQLTAAWLAQWDKRRSAVREVKLRPDQHLASLNNWEESAAFVRTSANG